MESKPNVMQRAGELLERLQAMQVTPAVAVTSEGCDALLAAIADAVRLRSKAIADVMAMHSAGKCKDAESCVCEHPDTEVTR